jgi:hypothetical protein
MISNCPKIGKNFSINVISFHGHGINFNGDPIAVISEETKDGEFEARFINMGGVARKFAAIKNTINIFLMSMCRVELDPKALQFVYEQSKNEQNEDINI